MNKRIPYFVAWMLLAVLTATGQTANLQERALWGSIAAATANGAINNGANQQYNGKLLLSWRLLPGDSESTAFDLYRRIGTAAETLVKSGIHVTNYVDDDAAVTSSTQDIAYRLTMSGSSETVGSYTIKADQLQGRLPYITIPLKSADDCSDYPKEFKYQANDCSVGDLDGDGQMEIVVKRLLTYYDAVTDTVKGTSEGAGDSDPRARHIVIFDAYKLDGTFLWRIKAGPNIIAGNSSNFAVADLDGDGCAEVVTKTGEGTVFGDGYEIPDTDGDGKTDYRDVWPSGHYTGDGPKGYGGPEFFSVIDGKTGRELARANFIARGKEGETPAELAKNWEANDWKWDPRTKRIQWKLANSLRLGVARFTGQGLQIFLGRGVYGRTVVEGWQYNGAGQEMTRLWKIDTDDAGGADKNKDGQPYSAYAGQGNHSFNVADLDGDGLDEVMYGSCAWDNDGTGLWTTGLGHGDANHVGVFQKGYEGLQVYHCLETGKTQVALHDGKTGRTIWQVDDTSDNDMGRCMVADVDPTSPGCEFWMFRNALFDQDGNELYDAEGNRKTEKSANAGIWFDGTLNRQLINEDYINSFANGRTFTMYRYDEKFINGTKSNPGWYGDMLGDWREEVIVPDKTKLANIKVFATWYPTNYRIPWLMTDHTYYMQCVHEQVGYNQPTNVGYYLGSEYTHDTEIWAAARQADRAYREKILGIYDEEALPTEVTTVYERGYTTDWAATDLAEGEWQGTGSLSASGITVSEGNSIVKTLTLDGTPVVTYDAVWNIGSKSGTNNFDNRCIFRIGDFISFEHYPRSAANWARIVVNGTEVKRIEGTPVEANALWTIHLVVDTESHLIRDFSVGSSNDAMTATLADIAAAIRSLPATTVYNTLTLETQKGTRPTTTLQKISVQQALPAKAVIAISDDCGWATYSNGELALDFSAVDGLKAYAVKVNGTTIELTPVGKAPRNTGLLLQAAQGTYQVPAVATADALADNDLLPTTGAFMSEAGYTFYGLTRKGTAAVFAKIGNFAPSKGKACLKVAATQAPEFYALGAVGTGLQEVRHQLPGTQTCYNLNGQRVARPSKGLYIVGGRKVLCK